MVARRTVVNNEGIEWFAWFRHHPRTNGLPVICSVRNEMHIFKSTARVLPLPQWRPSRRLVSHYSITHPQIDLSALFDSSSVHRQATLADMLSAMTRHGYFIARIPVLPVDYISSIYDILHGLHGLPSSVKADFTKPRGTYSGPDVGLPEDAYEVILERIGHNEVLSFHFFLFVPGAFPARPAPPLSVSWKKKIPSPERFNECPNT